MDEGAADIGTKITQSLYLISSIPSQHEGQDESAATPAILDGQARLVRGEYVTMHARSAPLNQSMRKTTIAAVLVTALLQTGCNAKPPASAPSPPTTATPFDTGIDTKQLMSWVIDPSSKTVFGAVASIITDKGEEQVQPRTDDEWNAVRNSAAIVLESGNLLMIDGRAKNSQIQDAQDWNAKARAMSAAARTAIEATEVKDPEALFVASGDIYQACTDCHAKYIFTPAPDAKQ